MKEYKIRFQIKLNREKNMSKILIVFFQKKKRETDKKH